MKKRPRQIDFDEELNVWPAFTDLMSNAFMILLLFLLIAILKSIFFQSTSNASQDEVAKLYKKLATLERNIKQKNKEINNLKKQTKSLKSPPLIIIEDSPERNFKSSSAELSPGLRSFIETKLVNQIEDNTKKYPGYIIDIIGHTDGQINAGSFSNLDTLLEKVAIGKEPVSRLQPGSNADLGLMRALAVVKVLQDIQKSKGSLKGLKFRAYSAAQLFLPQQRGYAPSNRNSDITRRRIEIRFTPPAVEQR